MMYKDEVYRYKKSFESMKELESHMETPEFINFAKEKFGRDLPFLWLINIGKKEEIFSPNPTKQGIAMDWRFYSEIDEITSEDINNEENIEKRFLLMMEYGINDYLRDVKIIDSDVYGTLVEASISEDDDIPKQRFVKVVNGTPEPLEKVDYYRKRGMLTDSGYRIYYIPVNSNVTTAKEAVADTWGLPTDLLPDEGWDFES